MIIRRPFIAHDSARSAPRGRTAAYTLIEVLIASSLFLLLLGGILVANIFGLKILAAITTKLSATDHARQSIGQFTDDIRTARSILVGNVSTNGVFVGLTDGQPQTGTSVLIYPSTNTTNFIVYYLTPSDQTFRRTKSAANSAITVLAQSITNTLPFRAQDFTGRLLTNSQGNRVIHLTLEFFQPRVQTANADYYKLETSVTVRALP